MSPKRVALYARTSTADKQDPSTQLNDLRNYAKARGFEIHREYVDQMSGATTKRPSLDELMNDARKRRFDVVLVWRFDRFGRTTKHLIEALAEFRTLKIDFCSFSENIDTSSAIGEVIFTVMSAFAAFERNMICERVRSGIRNARAKGRRLGKPPTINAAKVIELRGQGLSLAEIARQVNSTKSGVSKILKKQVPQVCGMMRAASSETAVL